MLRFDALFTPEAFTIAELSALKLDGEVYAVGDRHIPVDRGTTPRTKAQAVLPTNEEYFCISGMSALWVNGLTFEPRRHELALWSSKRPTDDLLSQREVRDLGDLGGKTTCFEGRQCLNVLDALIEVLRNPKVAEADIKGVLTHVSTHDHKLIAEARMKLEESTRVPFTNMALARLALADAVDVVDGVDPPHSVEHTF